ncbi:MAG: APC family permease [Acidimicrobiia bacterium]
MTSTLLRDREALRPLPAVPPVEIAESRRYLLKTKFLGRPLDTDQLQHERLGRPTALAVFASDALSSTAYASEEILRTLIPVVGLLAFSFVLPITLAMAGVLVILIFSYRQTIKAYPSAGGAYIVTKDNLGLLPAQVAGVALLTDYILTVAVSVSAGVAALYSAFGTLQPYRVPIALGFIVIIAWGNLRGVRESGRLFAVPTYLFLVSMFVMIGVGAYHAMTGGLQHAVPPHDAVKLGTEGSVGIFLLLHAFASGGAAMTGVEAISNGVPAFKAPEWKNARSTLMVMGACLGVMFIGISWLAMQMHVIPSDKKTVIAQIASGVFGSGTLGHVLFLVVQAATMLILVLAANTSFADFPRLASFHADDAFMPKQLTKRGHRLVFSNGIILLSVAAAGLVVLFQADVTHLIPLYAIGVFTSFTLSQAGMSVRHLRLHEQGWRMGLFVNGLGAIVTGVVTVVIAVTKFTHGAWAIMLLVPMLVFLLVRLNKQYESEKDQLTAGAAAAATAPVLRRHAVLVLLDTLDQSAARAMQYARTLRPDELRAVHLAADPDHAQRLMDEWHDLPLAKFPLEIVGCPDRRIARAALEVVAEEVADGRTEVTVLLPRREYQEFWHRFLHDRTSDSIARALSVLPHANVTFVPYQLGKDPGGRHATVVLGATDRS